MCLDSKNYYITAITPNLNTSKKQPRQYARWLVRARLDRGLPNGVLEDTEAWDRLVQRKRITMDPLDAIEILARAKGALRREKYGPLQSRLIDFVQATASIRLPKCISLRIPYADKQVGKAIKRAFDVYLNTVPYPKPIRTYLRTVLHVPNTTAPKLSNAFCQDRLTMSLSDMGRILEEPRAQCECHDGGEQCQQRVIFEPKEKVTTFSSTNDTLLRANLNRMVFPSWVKTERTTAEELLTMTRQVPKLRPFKLHNFQNVVYIILRNHISHLIANVVKRARTAHEKTGGGWGWTRKKR